MLGSGSGERERGNGGGRGLRVAPRVRANALALAASAFALAGAGLQLFGTAWGGGVSPDSAQYVVGARSLLAGEGYSFPDGAGQPQPIALWPPLYSGVLAAGGLFGPGPAAAGRVLNGALFAANLILIAFILRRFAPGSTWLPLIGGALFLLAPDLVEVHLWLWSEPLFILLFLSAQALLARFLALPTRRGLLAASAVAGLAGLTRYAGASLIVAGAAVVLWAPAARMAERLRRAAIYVALSAAPLAAFTARNALRGGSATTRALGFHRLYAVHFLPGLETVAGWAFPNLDENVRWKLGLAVLAAVLALFLAAEGPRLRQYLPGGAGERTGVALPLVIVLSLIVYAVLLVLAKIFVDPFFPFDGRILAPAQASLLVLVPLLFHRLLARSGAGPLRLRAPAAMALLAFVVVFLALHVQLAAQKTLRLVSLGHVKGLGYNSRSWQTSELVAFVAALDPGAAVFSNAEDGLIYSTGHPAWRLPGAGEVAGGEGSAGLERMRRRAGVGPAYVVYFDAISWREVATPGDLAPFFKLDDVVKAPEGSVLRIGSASLGRGGAFEVVMIRRHPQATRDTTPC